MSLLAAGLGLGCGVLTVIPIDDLRVGNPAGLWYGSGHEPYRSGEVIFSHEPHSFIECSSCHPGGSEPDAVRRGGLPSMARCLQCHDGKGGGASSACESCHQIERVGRRPSTHDASWQRDHGKDAEELAYQCALCHRESECQDCHQSRKPQSHTLRFLRSTHGRMANHQRASCATCHDADFCENCHSQPPPDHTPTFMTTGGHKQVARLLGRSCLTCHRFQEDCSRCHGG
ncbi:MAG: hypothetical protein ACREN5_16530 [Gemmatimonadales bacterium]